MKLYGFIWFGYNDTGRATIAMLSNITVNHISYSSFNGLSQIHIGDVMVNTLTLTAVDRGFEYQSGQTKDYTRDICCFSTKNAT